MIPPLTREIPFLLINGEGISSSGLNSHSLSQSAISFSLPRNVFLAAILTIPPALSLLVNTLEAGLGRMESIFAAAARSLLDFMGDSDGLAWREGLPRPNVVRRRRGVSGFGTSNSGLDTGTGGRLMVTFSFEGWMYS